MARGSDSTLRAKGALAAGLLATVVLTVGPLASAWGADRALFIAIDDYQLKALDLPPESSTRDARALADLARDQMGFPADGIRLLENQDASYEGILAAIDDWLIAGTGPGDRVMLTYAGHGTHIPDDGNDEEDGQDEALVPWDTDLDPKTATPINLLRDDVLQQRLALLKDRDVLVLVDSCYAGTMTRAAVDPHDPDRVITRNALGLKVAMARANLALNTVASTPTSAPSRSPSSSSSSGSAPKQDGGGGGGLVPIESMTHARVFAAAAAQEVAYVDPHVMPEQGVFTRALLEAVGKGAADSNGNGIISNAEVLLYLRRQSRDFCRHTRSCLSLTPTLETSSAMIGRDFRSGARADNRRQAAIDRFAVAPSANLSLSILPDRVVHLGDHVRFRVHSSIDGHLVVLDMNAAGEVVQLFPNMISRATDDIDRIHAGAPVTIPDRSYGFDFRAEPPVGKGTIVAVVSSRPLDLGDMLEANSRLDAITDPDAYVDRLAAALLAGSMTRDTPVSGKSESRPGDELSWGYTTADYTISP